MDELVIDIYRPRENAEELNNDEENGSAIESKLQFYQKICHIQPIRIAKLINHL